MRKKGNELRREEFLRELEKYLSGLEQSEVRTVLAFYEDYFNQQMANGKTEEDVINELGEPRLLAKSIKENYKKTGYSYKGSQQNAYEDGGTMKFRERTFRLDSWYGKLTAIVIGIILIMMVAAILAGVLAIFFKIVIPVFVILALVALIKSLFRR